MVVDDGLELHNAAKYLRGEMQPVPHGGLLSRHAKLSHFEQYRRTRQKALAVWLETVGMHDGFVAAAPNTTVGDVNEQGWRYDGDERGAPCLFWFASKWHCAIARWYNSSEKKQLKVNFIGYDREDAVTVCPQDPRIRRAVLDPRDERDQSNERVLAGIFPKTGDYVRVHFLDAIEAPLFLREGRYLAGVVVSPSAAHDSALVEVVGLAGPERFFVPNTRMEFVTAKGSSLVVEAFESERNQVLRQLDIATSQTIAMEVVSGVGKVADDTIPISLWALGDRLLVKVWQAKGEFMLETSVSAPEALAAVGMRGSGLTVLSEAERKQLIERVTEHLRVCDGVMEMDMSDVSQVQGVQHSAPPEDLRTKDTSDTGGAVLHRESHTLEGVSVETVVERTDAGGLLFKTRTLPPRPERTYDIFVHPEDWMTLGFPSLCWLGATRKANLTVQLMRCLRASDGSLALQIERVMRRPRSFIPFRSRRVSSEQDGCPAYDVAHSTPSTPRMCEMVHQNAESDSSCSSGTRADLCSCRVVLRAATLLPYSGTGILCGGDESPNTDAPLLPSRRNHRWLVVAKAIGGELKMSLFCPLRGDQARDGAGRTKTLGHFSRVGGGEQRTRQSQFLVATWDDWEGLGYGPLQWMSHAQKRFFGSLSLSWISFRRGAPNNHGNNEHAKPEAFLQLRPILSRVTRIVGTIAIDRTTTSSSGMKGLNTGVAGEPNARRSQVTVRDRGRDFIVDVEAEEAVHAPCSGTQQFFGKEAWRETGLGELLWIDRSWRRYLAGRLSHQVACCGSSLAVQSHVPVLYWSGTVTIARLGSHADGVFITVSDVGRRVLIEARDFDGGPMLASSTASLDEWTEATGIVALRPPTDEKAFRIRLEDQLAGLLGAGFRSRTKAMINRRLATKLVPGGGGRWRRTPYFSEKTIGVEVLDENDSGSDDGHVVTGVRPRPALSSAPSTPVKSSAAQKRALRLEMLTRMIDEYHVKHGRYGHRKGDTVSASNQAVGVGSDKVEEGSIRLPPHSNTNNSKTSNIARDKAGTKIDDGTSAAPMAVGTLPAIATPAQASRRTDTRNPVGQSLTTESSLYASDCSATGDSIEKGESDTKTLKTHVCACCGGDGGKGHGRRCRHTFRRCGFCRVDEVRRVLFGAEHGRDQIAALGHRGRAQRNELLVDVDLDGDEEDEYDWVTDTEEEDPEYECDTCGRVMGDNKDRFHCDTCGDYDLCQACFLSPKAPVGHENGEQVGSGHLASHGVSRIMARSTVPGRS